MQQEQKEFQTIRMTAKLSGVPQQRLRRWVRQGRVRGFTSGNRFYICVPQFIDELRSGAFIDNE